MADDDTVAANAQGLARCLRMLTEEAASLNLRHTFAALQNALATCQSELTDAADESFEIMMLGVRGAGVVLH